MSHHHGAGGKLPHDIKELGRGSKNGKGGRREKGERRGGIEERREKMCEEEKGEGENTVG